MIINMETQSMCLIEIGFLQIPGYKSVLLGGYVLLAEPHNNIARKYSPDERIAPQVSKL
jgi:hypothetical protein